MIHKSLYLLILILITPISNASEREEIYKCSAKKPPAERLICFDNLAKSLGVDKPITTLTVGKGEWIANIEKSPINDSTNVYLSVKADQSVRSGYSTETPSLFIRCSEGKTSAFINWNLYLGLDSTKMLTRLDKDPAVTKTFNISTDNKAVFVPGSATNFAKQLMAHNTLLAQITPYGESPVMATFKIGGLTEAIKPLRSACRW